MCDIISTKIAIVHIIFSVVQSMTINMVLYRLKFNHMHSNFCAHYQWYILKLALLVTSLLLATFFLYCFSVPGSLEKGKA